MITWLIGDNTFEVQDALGAIEASFDGQPERVDGAELSLAQLPDLLMGVSLFSSQRLVIVSDISTNSPVWEKLPDWLGRVSDDIHVVFIDAKPDKRTTSFKALKSSANVREFPAWSERDSAKAERWVTARAKQFGLTLNHNLARHLVSRVGVDQWQLAQAIEILSLFDDVSAERIDSSIAPNVQENIFQLFEAAIEGKGSQVSDMIKTFSLQENPHALFALLSSQALTLAAVAYAQDEPDAAPAKDFAIHPFVAEKLGRHGKRIGKVEAGRIVEMFAKTDANMKRSKAEPWILIEQLLLEITS